MAIAIPSMPCPTAAALAALAERIGHPLPPGYVEFVGLHDGARPEANSTLIPDNEISVRQFISVAEATRMANDIDGFPPNVIFLAEDDCGNYFYVEPRTGAVYFWDHELEGDERIASDPMRFIESLEPLDPARMELEPGQVKVVWANPFFKPEF